MKKIFLTIIFILTINIASADETVGGYPACISRDYFNQFVKAQINNDTQAADYLTSNQFCIISNSGIPITILDAGFGWRHVRAYATNGVAIELWTNSENVQ